MPAITGVGKTVSIEFSVVLLVEGNGGVHHVGAIIPDVTARRAAEQDMRLRLETLAADGPPG